ncbi:hypothetical protein TCE0_060f19436 [Talaromyces pinophilus]|uniref:Uncharacterized protein n=1 Tax=Talaromyces pinophilus TaxID=128442 RepID=A0A6V8HRJ2_TALPI|nr:Hypothetical protein PENO1_101650 [Penicillium occitanis (nom. inval.)]PCG90392.1 hypothetical protein PENOC_102250 [Penicillium occitanis (nom. inval.)]GAM44092.1 hypothetical protein TCE0_060f19436 [Talaromyces pinophilus]
MKLSYFSLLSLCLAAQAIALSIPARSNYARGDEIEDGTQIAEGWKRSADTANFAPNDEIEDGTQIAEGW